MKNENKYTVNLCHSFGWVSLFLVGLLCFCNCNKLYGQVLKINSPDFITQSCGIILEPPRIFWDSSGSILPKDIFNIYQNEQFIEFTNLPTERRNNPGVYWLNISLTNIDTTSDCLLCIYYFKEDSTFGSFANLTFYEIIQEDLFYASETGQECNQQNKSKDLRSNNRCVHVVQTDQYTESKQFLIKVERARQFLDNIQYYTNTYIVENEIKETEILSEWSNYFWHIALLGVLVFFAAFTFIQFILLKDEVYLLYSIYLFFLIIYNLEHFEWAYHFQFLASYFVEWHYCYEVPISCMTYLSYTYFAIKFLELKETSPSAYLIATRIAIAFYVLPVIDVILRMIGGTYLSMEWYDIYRWILFSSYLIFIVAILRSIKFANNSIPGWSYQAYCFVIGSFILFGSGVFGIMAKSFRSIFENVNLSDNLFFFQTGMIVENLFFMIGLGSRTRRKKEGLEKQIFAAKIDLLKLQEYSQRLSLNSHTFSNILSSINGLIGQNKVGEAEKYSRLFWELIRSWYEESQEQFVTLQTEFINIKRYVDLQRIRFSDALIFEIRNPQNLDLSFYDVPNKLLIPFVENAIDHGLLPSKRIKKLTITIQENESEVLSIIVEDNGIGTQNDLSGKKTSTGISNSTKRLKEYDIDVLISSEKNGLKKGTRVKLILFKR